jgi:hypothetical protein
LKYASGYFRNVMTAFEPKGYFHTKLVGELYSIRWDLTYLTGAIICFWFSRPILKFEVDLFSYIVIAEHFVFAIFAIFSIIPLYRILRSSKHLLDALSIVFSQTTAAAQRGIILRNLVISAAFFIIFVNYPIIISWLALPIIFNISSLVFGFLSIFFFWSAMRASSSWFLISGRKYITVSYPLAKMSSKDLVLVADKPKKKKPQTRSYP